MQRFTFLIGLAALFALMATGCEKSRDEGMAPEAQKPVEGTTGDIETGAQDLDQGARDIGEGAESEVEGTTEGVQEMGGEARRDTERAYEDTAGAIEDDRNREDTADEMAGDTGSPPASVDDEKLGVSECDKYYEKHLECINDNVPAAEREQLLNDLNEQRDGWKNELSQGADKEQLKQECKRAHEEAKERAKQYGCEL